MQLNPEKPSICQYLHGRAGIEKIHSQSNNQIKHTPRYVKNPVCAIFGRLERGFFRSTQNRKMFLPDAISRQTFSIEANRIFVQCKL
jgi:hypothetical protein